MPIYIPGKRNKRNKKNNSKRNVIAVLQLTAMVDMFTVLVVFLLQNYASTNQILPISDNIALPPASVVKELKPSFVVVLSKSFLSFNGKKLSSFQEIVDEPAWLIKPLLNPVKEMAQKIRAEKSSSKSDTSPFEYKITLQASKDIEVLFIKKVLYTLTMADVQEINFAVIKVKSVNKDL